MKQAPTETQNTLFPSLDHVRNLLREGIESSLWMTRRQEGKNTRIYTPQCLGTEDSAFAGTTSITPPLPIAHVPDACHTRARFCLMNS